jgi:hypothetical protein
MPESRSPSLSDVIDADGVRDGVRFQTEARLVRTAEFSGVFHLLAVGDRLCVPPVAVICPGKWHDPSSAHQAAQRHALTMAGDGERHILLDSLHRA